MGGGVVCDVADSRAVADLFGDWKAKFDRLDGLVHCAGITQDRVLWKMEDDAWSRVLQVNLDSAFYLLRSAAPLMREQGAGAVVLVSSINGERGRFGQANYTASKAGLIGLGRTAARELGLEPGRGRAHGLEVQFRREVIDLVAQQRRAHRHGAPQRLLTIAPVVILPERR